MLTEKERRDFEIEKAAYVPPVKQRHVCPACGGTGDRVNNIIGPVGEVRVCTPCGGTGIAR